MSTAGRVQGNAVDGGDYAVAEWTIASQNIPENYTTVYWHAGWHFGSTYCRGLRNGTCSLNGTVVYYNHNGGDAVHGYNSSHRHQGTDLWVADGFINVWHNADGAKEFQFWTEMTGYSGKYSVGNAWFALPTIPRMPNPPSTPTLSVIRPTSVDVSFVDGYTALPIDARQIGYGTASGSPQYTMSSDGSDTVPNLLPGTLYYFWARSHNSAGWSNWGPVSSTRTVGGVRVKVGTETKTAVVYVNQSGVWKPAKPYVKTAGEWKETM